MVKEKKREEKKELEEEKRKREEEGEQEDVSLEGKRMKRRGLERLVTMERLERLKDRSSY